VAFFGIDTVTASTLMVLAASASPYGDVCSKNQQVNVNVTPVMGGLSYNRSRSLKELQGTSVDIRDPYGLHDSFYTHSYARSEITPSVSIGFDYEEMHRRGRSVVCSRYKSVNVQIKIDSVITIAKELYEDRCMRDVLAAHEQKHIKIDREVVNKYAGSIGEKLDAVLKGERAVIGPVLKRHKQKTVKQMRHYLQKVIEFELQKMNVERQKRHRELDEAVAYDALGDKCTEFQDTKKFLYRDIEPKSSR